MYGRLFNYVWATNPDFRVKYSDLVDEFKETTIDMINVDITDIGKSLVNFWAMDEDLREEFPILLEDIIEMNNLTDDQIFEVILNAGDSRRSQGATQGMAQQQAGSIPGRG